MLDKKVSELFRAKEENTERFAKEEKHELRGEFDRDRDRILYSRAFRRLSGKTQVFLSSEDDHIRNRLSHTLEVAQIARTISKALGLNEILTEAIALGHDMGHTPFGHVGERTLNDIMSGCDALRTEYKNCLSDEQKGFKHNWQSIRVVKDLESCNNTNQGLNLTKYTLWGMLNHSGLKYKKCKFYDESNLKCTFRGSSEECRNINKTSSLKFYDKYNDILKNENITIEGLIVALSDEIAQRHHDVEDALVAKIIEFKDLKEKIKECYGDFFREDKGDNKRFTEIDHEKNNDIKKIMLSSFIVNLLTREVIYSLEKLLEGYQDLYNIYSSEDFEKKKLNDDFINHLKNDIDFNKHLKEKDKGFQHFIWNRILHSHKAQLMDGKGKFVIREIFKAYITNPQQLPDKTIERLFDNLKEEGIYTKRNNENVGDLRDELDDLHSKNNNTYKAVLMRTICDYISGMTDNYALSLHSQLYVSK